MAGYNWLPHVQADELGVKYIDLEAVYGRLNAYKLLPNNSDRWKVANALKIVSEVIPNNGGRMLLLRSVFQVVNKTSHALHLVATFTNPLTFHPQLDPSGYSASYKNGASLDETDEDIPFTVQPGEAFHIPLALLHGSVTRSATDANSKTKLKSLGYLRLRPADLAPVKESMDMDFSNLMIEKIELSEHCIDLYSLVEESALLLQSAELEFRPDGSLITTNRFDDEKYLKQLCCFIQARPKRLRKGGITSPSPNESALGLPSSSKLPPFCYNVDVRRIEPSLTKLSSKKESSEDRILKVTKGALRRLGQFVSPYAGGGHNWKDDVHPPLHYSIGIYLVLTLIYIYNWCGDKVFILLLYHVYICRYSPSATTRKPPSGRWVRILSTPLSYYNTTYICIHTSILLVPYYNSIHTHVCMQAVRDLQCYNQTCHMESETCTRC